VRLEVQAHLQKETHLTRSPSKSARLKPLPDEKPAPKVRIEVLTATTLSTGAFTGDALTVSQGTNKAEVNVRLVPSACAGAARRRAKSAKDPHKHLRALIRALLTKDKRSSASADGAPVWRVSGILSVATPLEDSDFTVDDSCNRTRIEVKSGRVVVQDLFSGQSFTLGPGESYVADRN
jgi:hypothetical protein